jgi:hypothetical protein
VQDIGEAELHVRELGLDRLELRLDGGELPRELLAEREERRRIAALALGLPGRLGICVALRAQTVGLDLYGLTLLLERAELVDVENEAAPREFAGYLG